MQDADVLFMYLWFYHVSSGGSKMNEKMNYNKNTIAEKLEIISKIYKKEKSTQIQSNSPSNASWFISSSYLLFKLLWS